MPGTSSKELLWHDGRVERLSSDLSSAAVSILQVTLPQFAEQISEVDALL